MENRLLASLPPDERRLLAAEGDSVRLSPHQVLHEPDQVAEYAYFPSSGAACQLTLLDDGSAVELATAGYEGMLDIAAYLGLPAPARWVVLAPGEALRIRASTLRTLAEKSASLSALMHNYMLATFVLVSQTAACNRRHSLEERCARWLLMAADRVEGNSIPMTHEFLADVLGVRRPSVSIALGTLSRAGMIDYRRGRLALQDRPALEAMSCRCYRVIRHAFEARFSSVSNI